MRGMQVSRTAKNCMSPAVLSCPGGGALSTEAAAYSPPRPHTIYSTRSTLLACRQPCNMEPEHHHHRHAAGAGRFRRVAAAAAQLPPQLRRSSAAAVLSTPTRPDGSLCSVCSVGKMSARG